MIVVGIGEMGVSDQRGEVIVTHALGTCIAVVAMDTAMNVAGLLHFQLPEPIGVLENPLRFGRLGIPIFLERCLELGARRGSLVLHLVGGMEREGQGSYFDIGEQNLEIARRLLGAQGFRYQADHVGGRRPRTVHMRVGNPEFRLSMPKGDGFEKELVS